MELQVLNSQGQSVGNVEVADAIFDRDFNETLVHQVVVAHLAAARRGSRGQRTRSEVSGGGIKPWRQKGTGRARAGSIRSPLWRGGGVTFAARPQSHAQKVNRKMFRNAVRAILSELRRQERLVVIDEPQMAAPKTREGVALLRRLGVSADDRVLLVIDQPQANLELALRNLPGAAVTTANALAPSVLVACDKVLISKAGLTRIGEWLA